ncbi:hypothetical protein RAD15_08895 [Bradyrhizobium sp. 14AA]
MKALLDGDSLELSGMTGAFRQQLHSGLTPGAAFRAGGHRQARIGGDEGDHTVSSSGKSIAHILHHLIGFGSQNSPATSSCWTASVLSKASETESRPRSPTERGQELSGSDHPADQVHCGRPNLMHGIGGIEGRFNSMSCGLGKCRPLRAQPEDRPSARAW